MAASNELPADLLDWVAQLTGATAVSSARHTARREAWKIETRGGDGATTRYFLRIDRALAQGQSSTRNLQRETGLIRALAANGFPAQHIVGWNDKHCAALQSWVPGRAELNRETRALQHSVMLDFMDILAKLHRVDVDRLDLPEFVKPATAEEHSLLELAAVEEPGRFPVSSTTVNPLAAFGKRWLINHVPTQVPATVLLQGDTGPANFMFDDRGVTAFVDWEWGHYGDPMEDLGNIWVRDYFYPSCAGNLSPYFQHYAKASGFALDYDRIHYYRVHQLVRSVIGLAYLTMYPDWRMPIPLNLGYSAVIDVETCRAIAEANSAAHAPVTIPIPTVADSANSLPQAMAQQLEQWVAPHIADAAAADITRGHASVLRYLDRREVSGAAFAAEELKNLQKLLGQGVTDLTQARAALIAEIAGLRIADEGPVLDHLTRVAANQAALMAPLTTLWQQCKWSVIG